MSYLQFISSKGPYVISIFENFLSSSATVLKIAMRLHPKSNLMFHHVSISNEKCVCYELLGISKKVSNYVAALEEIHFCYIPLQSTQFKIHYKLSQMMNILIHIASIVTSISNFVLPLAKVTCYCY